MTAEADRPADNAPDWTVGPFIPTDGTSFTDADLDALEPLWRALMDRHREVWELVPMRTYEDSWSRRRAQYREWLAAPGGFVLVARRGDDLLGYAVVGIEAADETYATSERQAEIHTLAVLPGERDRGLGAALMEAAERRLLADGVTDVLVGTMHGNDAAQRFYERRGYTPFVHVNYRKLDAPSGGA
jgi:ribosomal protein S18 acetylase RimI-like enzyme